MTKPVLRITRAHIVLGAIAWLAAFACAIACGFGGYLLWRFQ